jgi:hypothetical protein
VDANAKVHVNWATRTSASTLDIGDVRAGPLLNERSEKRAKQAQNKLKTQRILTWMAVDGTVKNTKYLMLRREGVKPGDASCWEIRARCWVMSESTATL